MYGGIKTKQAKGSSNDKQQNPFACRGTIGLARAMVSSSAIAIPMAIAAVALFQLPLDIITSAFFGLLLVEQLSLLALLFSTTFVAVAFAVGSFASTDESVATPHEYPLEAISAATTETDQFKASYEMLRTELLVHMKNNEMLPEALLWAQQMMDYNVPGGKLNRGTTVVSVHRTLKGGTLTPLEIARASVLGWAIEFLQAFFLVADDVMDDSQTRRGQPCWYKQPKVKMIAINDSFLLESYVFTMIHSHFGHTSYYNDLVALFLDVIQKTEFGQLLDLTSQEMDAKEPDLTRFTLERYKKIVKYKTAFYTFYLPVAIGMITSGVQSKEAFDLAREICCEMGEYFQIQDDFLDCFGSPEVIGKVGTDIQDNKCSWLVVQALAKATPAQLKILEQNYGKWDDKKVKKVKALYKEMGMEEFFAEYEEASYARIQKMLDQVTLMPKSVFELLLNKIYKRSK